MKSWTQFPEAFKTDSFVIVYFIPFQDHFHLIWQQKYRTQGDESSFGSAAENVSSAVIRPAYLLSSRVTNARKYIIRLLIHFCSLRYWKCDAKPSLCWVQELCVPDAPLQQSKGTAITTRSQGKSGSADGNKIKTGTKKRSAFGYLSEENVNMLASAHPIERSYLILYETHYRVKKAVCDE
jgi:hypothetical protein